MSLCFGSQCAKKVSPQKTTQLGKQIPVEIKCTLHLQMHINMVSFCSGSPKCKVCGGFHCDGVIQNCPSSMSRYACPEAASTKQRTTGLGTRIKLFLTYVGYTRSRHTAIKCWLHLPNCTKCRCSKREAALNTLGTRIHGLLAKLVGLYNPSTASRGVRIIKMCRPSKIKVVHTHKTRK